jgi:hypothetical protein
MSDDEGHFGDKVKVPTVPVGNKPETKLTDIKERKFHLMNRYSPPEDSVEYYEEELEEEDEKKEWLIEHL